jgi:hypothetical protein
VKFIIYLILVKSNWLNVAIHTMFDSLALDLNHKGCPSDVRDEVLFLFIFYIEMKALNTFFLLPFSSTYIFLFLLLLRAFLSFPPSNHWSGLVGSALINILLFPINYQGAVHPAGGFLSLLGTTMRKCSKYESTEIRLLP